MMRTLGWHFMLASFLEQAIPLAVLFVVLKLNHLIG